MPRRVEELPLIDRALLASLLALGLVFPGRAVSQDGPDVRALVEAALGVTRIHGETAVLVGFGGGLELSPSFSVGGAGYVLPASVDIGAVALQDLELDFGYGGIFGEYRFSPSAASGTWSGRLLLGAGNADVNDAATSLRLDSDNFLVVEPTLGFHHPLPYRLEASGGLSYRFVAGVDDLRGLDASDLRSFSLSLRLRLAPL